jgi:hydrogenase maturation factor HypF (carbamoyltransferase family)
MRIMLYKDTLYSLGEMLDIFAADKRIAQLQVVNVTNYSGQNAQDLECEIIQCHTEYTMGLKIFSNSNGYIKVRVQRN